MSVLTLRPDAPCREVVAEPVIDSFAKVNAGVIGVSIRLRVGNVQVMIGSYRAKLILQLPSSNLDSITRPC